MSRRIPTIVLAVSLATISLAGCKSSTTTNSAGGTPTGSTSTAAAGGAATTAAAGPVNVCTLMTAAQASTIVGVTYSAATPSVGSCSYATTTPGATQMEIFIKAGGAADWTAELATIQEGAGAAPITFTGVGDHAAGGGNEFGVQSGNWIIDILEGDPLGNGNTFPKSTALANALIPQLH